MSAKNSAELITGFPIFGIKFIDNKTVLAVGGGGEGNNGLPNKITAVKCSLKVKDKNRRLQKYREITLPPNEDSPTCVEAASIVSDDDTNHYIFVGCNQSTALIKNMNVNNNLRKYGFTDDEHLKFLDAVQFDHAVSADTIGSYPKVIRLSPSSEVGAFMTSQEPSEIYIFRPDHLEMVAKIRPSHGGVVRDFHISQNDGRTLCVVTASTVETINTYSGHIDSVSSQKADKRSAKILAKYNLSKVRFISDSLVVISGSLKSGKGSVLLRYDVLKHKVLSETLVHKKGVVVVEIDVSPVQNLIALANNDQSVTLVRMSDFKVLSNIKKLHGFAITSMSFSPSGTKLATGSASHTLNVMPIPKNYAKGSSFLGSLFRLIMFIFVIFAGVFLQQAAKSGQLDQYKDMLEQQIGPIDQYVELSKKYGEIAGEKAQVYGKIALELSQKYGSEYYDKAQIYGKIGYELLKEKSAYGIDLLKEKMNQDKLDSDEDTKPFFTMTEWEDKAVETETQTTANPTNDTLNDIVSEVTKDLGDLTNVEVEVDTDSLIKEAVTLDTQQASPSAEVSQDEEEVVQEEQHEIDEVDAAPIKAETPEAETTEIEATELHSTEPETTEPETTETATTASETILTVDTVEPEVSHDAEPESFAGTVLEDVREVEEVTASAEDAVETSIDFQNVEPEVVIEDEVTPEEATPSTESAQATPEVAEGIDQVAEEEIPDATASSTSTTVYPESIETESIEAASAVADASIPAEASASEKSAVSTEVVPEVDESKTTVPGAIKTIKIDLDAEEASEAIAASVSVTPEVEEALEEPSTASDESEVPAATPYASEEPKVSSSSEGAQTLDEVIESLATPEASSDVESTTFVTEPEAIASPEAETEIESIDVDEETTSAPASATSVSLSAESDAAASTTEEYLILSEAASKLSSEVSSLAESAASEEAEVHDEL